MVGGPHLVVHLSLLFIAMLRHSKQFPVWYHLVSKDKHGDLSNLDVYRGIALTPVISRLFESVLLDKYGNVLHSDCL